jgi:uncharacterized protein YeaO (DUF488 family)
MIAAGKPEKRKGATVSQRSRTKSRPRQPDIRTKRAYNPAAPDDGRRVLVDRLWPRGATHDALALDDWIKDVAPSNALRRWFNHDPARWAEFVTRYRAELSELPGRDLVAELVHSSAEGPLTLVYGARDEAHNNAVALREIILDSGSPTSK